MARMAGKLDAPRIVGHGNATNVLWLGRTFEAVSGDIELSGAGIGVGNGGVQLGALRAQGAGSLGMRDWKVDDASPVSFTGSIRNAPAADLLAIADIKNLPVNGTIGADAKVSGTIGDPHIEASVTAAKGAISTANHSTASPAR
jgi:autotransporter translocation and assembly factor TamB